MSTRPEHVESETLETYQLGQIGEQSRIEYTCATNAKGEVNVSFSIKVYAGTTTEEIQEILKNADALAASAIFTASGIKHRYEQALESAAVAARGIGSVEQ